jgi:hypothetical protein
MGITQETKRRKEFKKKYLKKGNYELVWNKASSGGRGSQSL